MERFVTSDGIGLSYYTDNFTNPWRRAETVLLLHAAMGSAQRYFGWIPHLCRNYRVVRLDLRGHGASQVPQAAEAPTLERLTRDVEELLDHLGCDRGAYRRQFGRRLSRAAAGDDPPAAGASSLSLFGSTPGLKNSQAPSWIPQIQAKGLRGFLAETIRDRLPAEADPGLVEWFLDEAARTTRPILASSCC